jgi:hypothetical protein
MLVCEAAGISTAANEQNYPNSWKRILDIIYEIEDRSYHHAETDVKRELKDRFEKFNSEVWS